MISYDLVQQQPKFTSQKDGNGNSSRIRVLGVIEDKKCILYSVASSKTTEIQLFNQYGISTTVIAFNKYMDIISADISFDVEMILYTERTIIPSTSKFRKSSDCDHLFKYETVICNINSFSKLHVFDDYNPIISYFLPYVENNKFTSNFDFYKTSNQSFNVINNQIENVTKTYQFIHVIGDKVSHFRATIKKQKIYIRVISNGININKCQKWVFSKRDLAFYSFNDGKFNAYNILNNKKGSSVVVDSHPYKNDPYSILPNELALKPSTLTNLPYFKFSSGISYVVKINNKNKVDYGVIEQLYKGEDSFLSFSVATVYGKFRNVVTIRGVQSDLPISFLSPKENQNAVFVFVPNCFISFVDFSFQNPHISVMPHAFSETTFPSKLVSTIDFETNLLTDLSTGKVYELSLNIESFPSSLHYTDRTILSIISRLVATFSTQVSISSAIENIPSDIFYVQFFFKSIFSILNQITPSKNIQLGTESEAHLKSLKFDILPRTRSDPTNKTYHNKLIKEDFCDSNSTKINNNFVSQNYIFNTDSKILDDSNISLSSTSSNSSVLSDKMTLDEKNMDQNQSKYYSEIANSIMKKADFVMLVHDNIELLFSSQKLSENRVFVLEIAAAFEAIHAKLPESSIFFKGCSERALRFCPLTIRQPFVFNNLINYKYKSINQINGSHIKNFESNAKSVSETNESKKKIIVNISNMQKNEKNQMLYWKRRFDFLKKDENFFESTKSLSMKKRAKSNIYIKFNNLDKSFENTPKELMFGELFGDGDEKLKLKTIPYTSGRRASLSASQARIEKTANV